MAKERVRAEARVISDNKTPGAVRAHVPRPVNLFLGARLGDTLVFEEGSAFVAERAAAKGPYLVVRLERAPQQAADGLQQAAHEVEEAAHDLVSFAEAVRRRREEGRA